jgi:hypothetical protein
MKHGAAKEEEEEASRHATEYVEAYLQIVQIVSAAERVNQPKFIQFLKESSSSRFPHRQELLRALIDPVRIGAGGMLIHTCDHELDYYKQRVHGREHGEEYAKRPYIFHGTKSTREIVQSWKLLQHDPGDRFGPGILFGQNFKTALQYALDYGIGNTRPLAKTHKRCSSVLVFRNNPEQLYQTHSYPGQDLYELRLGVCRNTH